MCYANPEPGRLAEIVVKSCNVSVVDLLVKVSTERNDIAIRGLTPNVTIVGLLVMVVHGGGRRRCREDSAPR